MPISGSYFYPQLTNDIKIGSFAAPAFLLQDGVPLHVSGAGRLFASGSGDNESVYYLRSSGEIIDLYNISGSLDIQIIDELDVAGVLTSSTNDNQVKFSSSIDFLNTYPDYHINARNGHLILSSSAGSTIAFSGNLDMLNNDIDNLHHIQFTTSGLGAHAHSEGSVYWDEDDKTLHVDTEANGVSLQVGQEMFVRATNKEGAQIDNGQVVYISGAQGQRPTVRLADNMTGSVSDATIGVATHNIGNNNTGYVTVFGLVRDIDTTGTPFGESWSDGDTLWLGPSSGSMTNIEPVSPAHEVKIGYVVYSHATEGKIFAHIDTGGELGDVHDVLITSVANNDILLYDSASLLWKNQPASNILSGSSFVSSFRSVSSDYKLTNQDRVVEVDTYSNAVEIMLPTAAGITGTEYIIKRISSGSFLLTLAATGSELIDRNNSYTISDCDVSVSIISNGSKWLFI